MKTSEINVTIRLDEKNVPENISWNATDAEPGNHPATAMLLAFWDQQSKNGLSIDLWTKDMTVPEMNIFMYQTFLSLSDSFQRSTQNSQMSNKIREFANEFWAQVKDN